MKKRGCPSFDGTCVWLAVAIGSRVASKADTDEILVSRTVCDLVAGSGITSTNSVTHEPKGIPGNWELFGQEHAEN